MKEQIQKDKASASKHAKEMQEIHFGPSDERKRSSLQLELNDEMPDNHVD